jgi:hypothetical protein
MPVEVDKATTQLYHELKTSNAAYVEKPRNVLGMSVAATPGIVDLVKSWLARRHLDTVTVKIKLGDDEIEFLAPAAATPSLNLLISPKSTT